MIADPTTSQEEDIQYDFVPANFLNSFFDTAKAVLLSPRLFYSRMKTEGGLRNPTIFLVSCVVIHTAIATLVLGHHALTFAKVALGIGLPFATAGIMFLIVTRLYKASGTYEAAFRVNAYAAALNLFTWVPILMILLIIELYRIYLMAWGLAHAFSMRVSRAVFAIVITIFIYAALGTLLGPVFLGGQAPTASP